jgi:quercetin dioxygenase-like cupin family protein
MAAVRSPYAFARNFVTVGRSAITKAFTPMKTKRLYVRKTSGPMTVLIRPTAGATCARTGWFPPHLYGSLERKEKQMHYATTFTLAKGELVSFRSSMRPFRLTCLAGTLWATIGGDPKDYLVGPGESASFPQGGAVVIQALRAANVRVEQARQPETLADYPPGSRTISNTTVAVP